ncbi:glycoside hydrolase family 2 TIM barrel-domain containing protein [Streptomyces sp. NPDC059352]|uniref:glycoside hydrolase family 2 TIM barrel-domain containing protein n=1 Tax=Streptomyces sp. NPDC059352 TaxID=3346810 RepID=UPI00368B28DD
MTGATPQNTAAIAVKAPRKWDAEHPNLYTLTATYTSGGQTQTVRREIGFRQVKAAGNQLLVNGKPVHLLGVCHHSISPGEGRSAGPLLEEQAVRLYKEANCNFIRTSHYPRPRCCSSGPTVWASMSKTGGEHTVTVRVTGRKNAASADAYVSLDAFEALGGDPFAMDTAAVGLIVSARVNYPDLAWGNYVDPPINLSAGRTGTARVRLLG